MMTFFRVFFMALAMLILVAISHDASVGSLSGGGAAGATAILLVIAMAWRGMDYLEAESN